MYGSAIRLVPVHWVLAFFNAVTFLYDSAFYICERIFSFLNAAIWNLAGYDQVYVFQDNCPTPIPYRAFMLGGTGRYKWFYNTRSREFEAWIEGSKKQFLPALSINIRQTYTDENSPNNRYEYDMTRWLDTVKFKTVDNCFPHPMQLVAAWSLHSGIWPSFVNHADKQTRITMVSGTDGESYDIDVSTTISAFRWRDFVAGSAGTVSSSEEETSSSEYESEESESEESEAESETSSSESEESEAEEADRKSVTCESNSESKEDDNKSVPNTESDVNTPEDETLKVTAVEQLVCEMPSKALFLAGGTDEIHTWTADWTIMPSSFASFMSTMTLYEVGLPPIDGYTPTVNPDMEAVD